MSDVIVIFAVSDIEASSRLYSEVFGFDIEVKAANYIELRISATASFGLYQRDAFPNNFDGRLAPEASGVAQPAELYLRVADAPAIIEALQARGLTLKSPLAMRPWGEQAAYFLDPGWLRGGRCTTAVVRAAEPGSAGGCLGGAEIGVANPAPGGRIWVHRESSSNQLRLSGQHLSISHGGRCDAPPRRRRGRCGLVGDR